MRKAVQILAAAALLVGAAVFAAPYVNRWQAASDSADAAEIFEAETVLGHEEEISVEDKPQPDDAGQVPAENLAELKERLHTYNRELYEGGQINLKDPFSYETTGFDLTEYGLSQNIIGVLWIPRLNQRLPIYLGANAENMAKGAALLGQTSMPLGETDSNTVIAAHRGFRGIPMFRDIQSIQIGDKIQITTLWETLIYRVCDLKIINPDDSGEILIQEGRELVTLLTCHPYTQNYQRYLVYAERSDEEIRSAEEDLEEVNETWDSAPREVKDETGEETVTVRVEPASIRPSFSEGTQEQGAGDSNLRIWMESYGMWLLLATVIVLAAAAGAWLRRKKSAGDDKSE